MALLRYIILRKDEKTALWQAVHRPKESRRHFKGVRMDSEIYFGVLGRQNDIGF